MKTSVTVKTTKRNGTTRWKCSACKKEHVFSAYVVAHWRDELEHTCDCGAKHSILEGVVTAIRGTDR